jgi:hypothetical protein
MGNIMLESRFTEEEVKEAVFGSYDGGTPRPNGISLFFYQ